MRRVLLRGLAVLAILSCVAAGGLMCQRVAMRGRFAGDYSSYGSGPAGTRALYLLAERIGVRPERWSQDLAHLPEGAMLVAAGGCASDLSRSLSRYESEELVRWVERGGVLFVAGARDYLPDGLGVRFEREPGCDAAPLLFGGESESESESGTESESESESESGAETESGAESETESESESGAEPETESESESEDVVQSGPQAPADGPVLEAEPALDGFELQLEEDDLRRFRGVHVAWTAVEGELLAGLEEIPMEQPGRFDLDSNVHYEVLLSMQDAPSMPLSPVRRDAGIVVDHGRGHVIVLASASMLQNSSLAGSDGAVLFSRLVRHFAPAGPVLFDEYHLGIGERRSMMLYFRQMGVTPIVAQLLFVLLLVLWRGGARFGAVREPAVAAPRGTASFVAAMGSLFARAQDPAGAFDVLLRDALGRVAAHHHLPTGSVRTLSQALRARGAVSAAAAVEELPRARDALTAERGGLADAVRRLDAAVARACG